MDDFMKYWVWFAEACGAGSEAASSLLARFGSPAEVFTLPEKELKSLGILSEKLVYRLADKSLTEAEKTVELCERSGYGIINVKSPVYPVKLRSIYSKPVVLYYAGKFIDTDSALSVACVGTRGCTHYGAAESYRFSSELAAAGAVVVSGMAKGTDTFAHRGALDAGGKTIAVLGCGLDIAYPASNTELMKEITLKGTVISEYPPGSKPERYHFPVRNRIISGLSDVTVVIEAGVNSGALITAEKAIKQGRRVFAVPGRNTDEASFGSNMLISEGAYSLTDSRDIISEYLRLYPELDPEAAERRRKQNEKYIKALAEGDSPVAGGSGREGKKEAAAEKQPVKRKEPSGDVSVFGRVLYRALEKKMSADEIKSRAREIFGREVEMGEILGMLTELEMDGCIEALPGGVYKLS